MARPPPDPYFILRCHLGAVTALCFLNQEEEEQQQCHSSQDLVPFDPKQLYLLSGSDAGEVFLWDLKVNRVICRLDQPDKKMVLWLNYFWNKILSQIREIGIKIWSYTGNDWLVTGTISSEGSSFCSSAMLNTYDNTNLIITGSENSSLHIVDFETRKVTSVLKPQVSCGLCMCLNAFMLNKREYALCGYESGSVMLWDLHSSSTLSTLPCHEEPVMCLDFDMQRQSGISGSADDHLVVWKLDSELKLFVKQKIKLTNPGVASVAIRPDGKIVIVGCWDSSVRVFSWKNLKPLAVLKFHENTINCIRFSSKAFGKHHNVFAAGSKDKNISLWSLY